MKVINRIIEPQITNLLESNKVILILGTRRVGKTFLINSIQNYSWNHYALVVKDGIFSSSSFNIYFNGCNIKSNTCNYPDTSKYRYLNIHVHICPGVFLVGSLPYQISKLEAFDFQCALNTRKQFLMNIAQEV